MVTGIFRGRPLSGRVFRSLSCFVENRGRLAEAQEGDFRDVFPRARGWLQGSGVDDCHAPLERELDGNGIDYFRFFESILAALYRESGSGISNPLTLVISVSPPLLNINLRKSSPYSGQLSRGSGRWWSSVSSAGRLTGP